MPLSVFQLQQQNESQVEGSRKMIKLVRWLESHRPFFIALTLLCSVLVGCEYFPESTFKLASDSRLPKWITLPGGLTRTQVSITMDYYIRPWGNSARFIVQDPTGRVLQKAVGKVKCNEPFHLKAPRQVSEPIYPSYEPITVSGVTEIIEHRKMQPIFYVTDDDAVWKQFRTTGCG